MVQFNCGSFFVLSEFHLHFTITVSWTGHPQSFICHTVFLLGDGTPLILYPISPFSSPVISLYRNEFWSLQEKNKQQKNDLKKKSNYFGSITYLVFLNVLYDEGAVVSSQQQPISHQLPLNYFASFDQQEEDIWLHQIKHKNREHNLTLWNIFGNFRGKKVQSI